MREKFTLIKSLQDRAKELGDNKLPLVGTADFTAANNIMRQTMNIKHKVQHLAINEPEFPMLFDGKENVEGKYSTYYTEAKKKYKVIDIIKKYDQRFKGNVKFALMFLYNEDDDEYRVVERREVENLSEHFGFKYNNEYFDACQVGDVIDEGDIIAKSPSYMDDELVGCGVNGRIVFATDPWVQDDAICISESFAKRMSVSDVTSLSIPVNDDTILLNLYGDDKNYRPLPDIGEHVKGGIVCASRILRPQKMFSDFRDSMLSSINLQSDSIFYGDGVVVDINVYCNNKKISTNRTNKQVLDYLQESKYFYSKVYRCCKAIMNQNPKNVDREIGHWLRLAINNLDEDAIWAFNDNTFSNIMIEILLVNETFLNLGRKIVGRHGNKTVISRIIPDDQMMYLTEDTFTDEYGVDHPKGERIPVELITNPLAIINRTIPMAMFETSITFILDKVSRAMRKLPFDEARDLMFDVLDTLNPTFAKEYKNDVYDKLSDRDKRIAIEDAAKGEISIRWDAFDDSNSWRDNILKCYEKFPDILKPYHIFRPKKEWGRDVFVGEGHIGLQYMYMLKQSGERGYSVRSAGSINNTSLPERSNDKKIGKSHHSSTPIRFGEYELPNFLIAINPEDYALITALYRSSVDGRRFMYEAILSDDGRYEIPNDFTSRTSEVLEVYMKSLGIKMSTVFDEDEWISDGTENELIGYKLKQEILFCTMDEMYYLKKLKKVYKRYQKESPNNIDDTELAWDYIMEHLPFKKKFLTDNIVKLFKNNIQLFS